MSVCFSLSREEDWAIPVQMVIVTINHYEVIVDKNVNNAIVCQRCYFIKHSMAQRGTPHCNCLLLFNETNERVYWACTPERANVTFE